MDIFDKALKFAIEAHSGMVRKASDKPYILHPIEVAAIAGSRTDDRNVMAAAALHDVVEDTPITEEDIKLNFGDRIAGLVASETENKRPEMPAQDSWIIRKEESLCALKQTDDVGVKILWLSDKLSNMRSFYREYIEHGERFWDGFNQKDPKIQEWYYRMIAGLTVELKDHPAWQEYSELINRVFGGEDK